MASPLTDLIEGAGSHDSWIPSPIGRNLI